MDDLAHQRATSLGIILAAITPHLKTSEVDDIESFITAGEYGLAADTIFSAIDEDHIPLDDDFVEHLTTVEDLYNTFGDLDPELASNVLRHHLRPMTFRV